MKRLLFLVVLFQATGAIGSPITIDTGTTLVMTGRDCAVSCGSGRDDVYNTTDPNLDVTRTLAQGETSVTTTSRWKDLGDQHTFDFVFSIARNAALGSFADTS